ncbi:HlyD family efflux transporter periplasmic adaptor subunit [Niveibacterium sp. SC-1]|uniref:HlyD family efflux transporter periplasmic adaptor subunit n=1 Tax=Niveibacterium sp. SC-1 TaxID=3135646 RepID=UPI00311E90E1
MDTAALPPLREDLRLSEGAAGANGEPVWMIQDVVLNRFYRIGWLEFEFLARWARPAQDICEEIARDTPLRPEPAQLADFVRFLSQHQLLRASQETLARLRAGKEGPGWLNWRWWLHHYLFFRIPLVRPQAHLQSLAQALRFVFTPWFAAAIAAASLLGIVLVAKEWDTFTSAVVESFSVDGLLSFAAAIAIAKTLHELAHALVATRYGLRVAHMGVAFVVMWPMLYTDTGETWKLRSARQRLAVASAGILCELSIAGLSTLGWALAEPGPLRNGLLYLATTSWVLSLALNASPFMRFDGYFILSDLLDFPNLHERAGAMAKAFLHRTLLGLPEDWPEPLPAAQRRLLIGFAFTTWLYRLVLFLGIAVTVYLFFFKLLGIFLFMVEISWFIALPVLRELRYWWAHRQGVPTRRRLYAAALGILLLLLLAIPWRTQVHAVGVARSEHQLKVFAPFAARLQQVQADGEVKAGSILVTLDQPDLVLREAGSEAGRKGYAATLAGLLANATGLEVEAATRERLEVQREETRATRLEIARLKLIAPFDGVWRDVDPAWQAGQWIANRESIGVLLDPSRWQIDAYVPQRDLERLQVGSRARFYADGDAHPQEGTIVEIGRTRVKQLPHPMLASRYKGPLTSSPDGRELPPGSPVFHVLVQLDQPPADLRETRGQLQIEGQRHSIVAQLATDLGAALLRESGF